MWRRCWGCDLFVLLMDGCLDLGSSNSWLLIKGNHSRSRLMPFREITQSPQGFVGVGVDLTEVCNRKCPTCFAANTPQNMSWYTFCRIVDEAYLCSFPELYILGGEPTLHPRIIDMLNYAKDKFKLVILVSNMDRLADLAFCKLVEATGVVIAGQRHVVGVSQNEREIETLLTGGNHLYTSHKAWENVKSVFSPDRVVVQCCITEPVVSSGSLFDVFRWARRSGYEPVMEMTKEGSMFKRANPLDVDSQTVLSVLKEFQRIDRDEFGLSGAEYLTPQAYGKTCHMQETSIHFRVNGSSIPCVGFQGLTYGDISLSSLEEIMVHPLRQLIANPKEWIYGYCRESCFLFDVCTGGCRGSAFDMSGCYRASFMYCPHVPSHLSLVDMIPQTCEGCPLEGHPSCNPCR
jgi:radical SAM protein with 4Fe4S-binding SPASM domain